VSASRNGSGAHNAKQQSRAEQGESGWVAVPVRGGETVGKDRYSPSSGGGGGGGGGGGEGVLDALHLRTKRTQFAF